MKPEAPQEDPDRKPVAAGFGDGETALHATARQAIEAGRLPLRRPDRIWGGPGAGANCTICGARVKGDEVEFEIEYARDEDGSDSRKHHVHLRCFAAWEAELRKREPDGRERALPQTGKEGHNVTRGDNGYRRGSA